MQKCSLERATDGYGERGFGPADGGPPARVGSAVLQLLSLIFLPMHGTPRTCPKYMPRHDSPQANGAYTGGGACRYERGVHLNETGRTGTGTCTVHVRGGA